jgi:radical SAM protein with 4Fe4S-binding SPASM domain
MNCSFCFNNGLEATGDIGVDEFRDMVSAISGAGVESIDVLGGEPTLHIEIEDLVRIALEAGLKVTMSTNGSRIRTMERLLNTFGKDFKLGVSVNGALPEGLDDFLKAYKPNVKSLFREGPELLSLIRMILSKGVEEYYVIYPDVLPGNREAPIPFRRYHETVGGLDMSMPEVHPVYCSGFLPDAGAYPELLHARCPAGVTKLGIMPDGSAYPCNLFFGNSEFYLGNILSSGLEDIWGSPGLDFFRRFEGNSCPVKNCLLHTRCHGGCPAVALKWFARIDAPDLRCLTSSRTSSSGPQRRRISWSASRGDTDPGSLSNPGPREASGTPPERASPSP